MRFLIGLMSCAVILVACDTGGGSTTIVETTVVAVPSTAPATSTSTSTAASAPATTLGGFPLEAIDITRADPYAGSGCIEGQVLLSDPNGFVAVLDVEEVMAYRLGLFKKAGDVPVFAFGAESLLVAGEEGLVLISGSTRDVLVPPPSGEAAFVPYVRVLDTRCTDDETLTLIVAGEFDTWFVDSWGMAEVTSDGLTSFRPLEASFEFDFAEFSPTGAYASLALFGPDPAFGGRWGILDVDRGAEIAVPDEVPMAPTGDEPTVFVGPMTWTDEQTVRQHWKIGDGAIQAADIRLPAGEAVSAAPASVTGWTGSCPVQITFGIIRHDVLGRLATVDEPVRVFCW